MRSTLTSGTRVQYTQPPKGSLNGIPSSRTSVRLWPLGPIPRSDTPCVVGCAAAQPTTQGVSLRGIGPSGQSRTLVLLDGVPFNDPFGGWVYWTRIPMVSVDRIEVTEDTASGLYGNYAMGGVINIVTSRPTRHTLELKPQYGSFSGANASTDNGGTPKIDGFASDIWKKVGFAVEGSAFNTDGFKTVTTEAGPIDNNAAVEYSNISGKVEYLPSDRLGFSGRVGYFNESRD